MSGPSLSPLPALTPSIFAVDRPAVLVVDDDPPVRRAVERVLRVHGVTVYSAEGPGAARELLGEVAVHAVISDLKMPGEDGISFLSWVREHYPDTQRILLSGHYEIHDVELAINHAGVHRFLSKPYAAPALVETIRQSVEQWAVAAERDRLLEVTTRQKEALLSLTADLEVKVAHRTAALERATRTWRSTFDSIADPLALVDDALRIRRANLAVAEVAREDIRTLIGRQCYEVHFGRSEPCEACPIERVKQGDRAPVEITDERTGRSWSVSAWPLTEEGQTADGEASFVCHYKDVSNSKALHQQVVTLEKLAAIGELAGCVAHELNNPLTGILTFSQIMRRGAADPDEVVNLSQDIEEAARRCTRIVQSLLDFARGGTQVVGEPADVDIAALISDSVNMARLQVKESAPLEIRWEPTADMPPVRGHADALKSLFLNLITNAIQAMEARGALEVSARYRPEERLIEIVVEDDGPGIPPHLIDQIFRPFFTTKAKNRGGTGLGLAIVSNVVAEHGGRITVSNVPEGGARFGVELPVVVG